MLLAVIYSSTIVQALEHAVSVALVAAALAADAVVVVDVIVEVRKCIAEALVSVLAVGEFLAAALAHVRHHASLAIAPAGVLIHALLADRQADVAAVAVFILLAAESQVGRSLQSESSSSATVAASPACCLCRCGRDAAARGQCVLREQLCGHTGMHQDRINAVRRSEGTIAGPPCGFKTNARCE